MECALVGAGVQRRPANNTPAGLPGRARARGLLSPVGAIAAGELTGLCHRGPLLRRHPAPVGSRDDAAHALAVLHDEFAARTANTT